MVDELTKVSVPIGVLLTLVSENPVVYVFGVLTGMVFFVLLQKGYQWMSKRK